ncbi:MAG: PEGA domain-containing protein [Candidatus Brocadiae bacterium]|nr:PEGA domain-containing protein [Candidatus Brocadiia bacterium]
MKTHYIFLFFFILCCWGCVERKITIVSDPQGAHVWLDGEKVGETPVSVPFSFYGTREITVSKEGYQLHSSMESIQAPVYQYFPLDFVSEFLIPVSLQDEHKFLYTLKPYFPLTAKQKKDLEKRADALRTQKIQK